MNIDMITMDPAAALQAYRDYQAAVRAERRDVRSAWKAEDVALMKGYKELAKGRQLLNLRQAMVTAGLREDGYPRLAIARSYLEKVFCRVGYDGDMLFSSDAPRWGQGAVKAERIEFGRETFPKSRREVRGNVVSTLVPIIPPALRPKINLSNFHTLWEVESWTLEPPKDPLLLRHLGGELYAVLAVWDLTELERAVLGGRARA